MKLIYTNENRFLVSNVKNIVEASGIPVVLRNEYAIGGAGDLSPFDTWLELWVEDDADYTKAKQVIKDSFCTDSTAEWICGECKESNDASFEFCWQCQHEK